MTVNSPDASAPPRASAAGIYDALLGGTNNTSADRAAAERLLELEPVVRQMAWANRGFLQRAAGWIARQGVRDFIDIGAGLPTMNNTHDVVTAIDPASRVVYVDNDPGVVTRGQQLLGHVEGAVYIQRDLTDDDLLEHPELAKVVSLGQPVGLLIAGVLYFVPDAADPVGKVRRMVDALPSGSYLAVSHVISDKQDERVVKGGTDVYKTSSTAQLHVRTTEQVTRFFDGLEIVPPYPGADPVVTYIGLWGAEEPSLADDDASRWFVAAVARKH